MRDKTRILVALNAIPAILILLAVSFGLDAQPASNHSVADVRIEKVELSDIGLDSVAAAVRLSATARNSVTMSTIAFDQIAINGVPVRVPPVAGPIRLTAEHQIDGLPELRVVLMYRELDSLSPLRRAVQDGSAHVHAVVRAQLETNLFEKLMLRSRDAWVTIQIDQDVPIGIPGGPLGRVAATAALLAAEPVWIAGQDAQEWRRNRTALAEKVRATLPGHVVSLETRYQLRARGGEVADLRAWASGFRIGGGEVVAPAEAVEPWMFDDSVAEALERGDVSVNASKTEILATPVAAGTASARTYSLQHKELRIVKTLSGSETAISVDTKHRYHVRFRDRDTNAVLLEIPALKESGSGLDLSGRVQHNSDWEPAAVVRWGREGDDSECGIWLTEARWENGRYRIKDPVEATAFGSPLWTEDGLAGMLQDQSTAAEANGLLKRLR